MHEKKKLDGKFVRNVAPLCSNEIVMKSRFISMTHLKKIFIHIGIFLDDDQFSMICKWFGRNGIQIDACVFLTHLNNAITRVCKSGSYDPKKMAKKVGKRYINTCFPKIIHPDVNADEIHDFFQQGKSTHGSQERWFERCEDFTDLITRLQRSIHINQIIARPRFQQFDNLNSGRITVPQFTRALDLCEINTNGKTRIFISPLEMQKLIEVYSESYEPGYVMWRLFVNDIESGNCIRDLHRKPSANVSDHEPMGPRKEVLDLECKYSRRKEMTLIEHRRAERILEYVRQQLRDCELYQFFRAFDKENRRHITRNQFREIMRISNVLLREQDVYDLELYFVDYYGFCYMFFLQVFGIITPPPRLVPTEDINKYRKVASTSGYAPYEAEGTTGVEVLTKIRHTVFQRSLRLKYFFETFDRFNTGVMDENTFLRALSSAHNWAFTYSEYKKLMAMFRRPLAENDIEYKKFLSALDELYTQPCLEQSPLVKPVPYQGWKDHVQELTLKERTELGKAIHKIVHKGLCLDHLVAFKDMDIYHCSTIPYDKYIQGMETAGVRKYLSLREQKLIFKAFTRPVYHRTEFDYTRFLKACHHVCPMPVVYL
ncbi:unnamed protein product [Nezara viridula]|uniref:Uncharacterized protein n=1 Tax=Nezara viridula TaxID=85310 RepID=A0A9P0H0S3_NEZVI|nr:unnamed protein product [Nezara viridula]